ncbi:aminotransferase class III-fold pyridoxal phosphate-dependent enzyme [Kineosporia rhizophila]|uniref:daptide-type RiPP biosynthesis aminotransferase n=1 Tax=Kineosporia rhizophila TaxID=84633 RepID=UPI001E57C9A5|nr:daptide-type RiPP biosynthesis aminotransferase [Kineosporia rhizophila]MCE0539272.1 aminotransferase class III-fold pyridoxal phosphate-dependent enzyme [Kineosporia rhizophila]
MSPTARPPALWPALIPRADHLREDLCLVGAKGHRVRFADGREALCGTSGLWNVNLGYGNEAVAEASAQALRDASYLSVFRYSNSYARAAAETVVGLAGPDRFARVLFSTSGGAANDAVLKLVRHVHAIEGHSARRIVIGLRGSYHGLTYGGFSLTGENLGQQLYGVDPRFVRHVNPNAVDELTEVLAELGDRVAAVVVEPVLGSGTIALDDDYVAALLALRSQHGFLLVADEVATGYGRTGPMFASSAWPAAPDVLITSKGLTNGAAAAAAVLVSHRIAQAFEGSDQVLVHAETQAGTPASCAVISAVAEEFARLDALGNGQRLAAALDAGLTSLADRLPVPTSTAGRGLFRTLHAHTADGAPVGPAVVAQLITAVREAGAVVHPGPGGIQLIPALTYSEAEVTELLGCVELGFARVAASGGFGRPESPAPALERAS